jgi:hypothetical protein
MAVFLLGEVGLRRLYYDFKISI